MSVLAVADSKSSQQFLRLIDTRKGQEIGRLDGFSYPFSTNDAGSRWIFRQPYVGSLKVVTKAEIETLVSASKHGAEAP